jgi:hypothetical protein
VGIRILKRHTRDIQRQQPRTRRRKTAAERDARLFPNFKDWIPETLDSTESSSSPVIPKRDLIFCMKIDLSPSHPITFRYTAMTGRRHLGTNVSLARQRRFLNRMDHALEIKLAQQLTSTTNGYSVSVRSLFGHTRSSRNDSRPHVQPDNLSSNETAYRSRSTTG